MNTTIKLLLPLLLLLGIGYGALQLMQDPGDEDNVIEPGQPGVIDNGDKPAPAPAPSTPLKGEAKEESKKPKSEEPERKRLTILERDGANFEQGVRGRLLDGNGYPVSDAELFLMQGMGMNPLEMFRRQQEGEVFPPLAVCKSDAQGRFKLGLEKHAEGHSYEVRILHEKFCDHSLPNIHIQPRDWWYAGDIELKTGVVIYGRVTSIHGLPIPEAKVTINVSQAMMNFSTTPGREDGISVMTDQSGNYRFENIDPIAMITMSAVAEDFAKSQNSEVKIAAETANEVNFQLGPGLSISGVVVGPTGEPIPHAMVTAATLSQKSRLVEQCRTNLDGDFLVQGLEPGAYSVIVKAPGFVDHPEKPIAAGTQDLQITLEKKGSVEVQVLGRNGNPLRNYFVNVKACFEGQEHYGNPVLSQPVRNARNGTVILEGINPFNYVVEVIADKYSKAFSEPFTITEGQLETPKVLVQLDQGGAMRGTIVDGQGSPVAGVQVETMPNSFIENPFTRIFPIPFKITKKSAKTNSKGTFHFTLLYPGRYQLKLTNPLFCNTFLQDIEVQKGQTTDIPTIQISRGCVVTGITTVDGKAKGQVKVTVSAQADPKNPMPFSCEAISDNAGRFVLNKRLQPGTYESMAAEQVQGNALLMIVQFSKSKKTFHIKKGQKTLVLNIDLKSLQ